MTRRLTALGAIAASAPPATARGQTLIGALSAILRAVALVDGLVCLYTLVQALATTARERRTTIAVLRACGAGAGAIRILLAGAAAAVVAPAALIGVILEEAVLGPVMSHLAAGYAALPLSAGPGEVVAVVGGLALLAAGAATWVAGQSARESIVSGLAR